MSFERLARYSCRFWMKLFPEVPTAMNRQPHWWPKMRTRPTRWVDRRQKRCQTSWGHASKLVLPLQKKKNKKHTIRISKSSAHTIHIEITYIYFGGHRRLHNTRICLLLHPISRLFYKNKRCTDFFLFFIIRSVKNRIKYLLNAFCRSDFAERLNFLLFECRQSQLHKISI